MHFACQASETGKSLNLQYRERVRGGNHWVKPRSGSRCEGFHTVGRGLLIGMIFSMQSSAVRWLPLLLPLLLTPVESRGYSVLTHEAIIDAAWDREIQPHLKGRFPQSSP